MISAKCVGGTDVTGVSDDFVTMYPAEHNIVRYAQVQGNATSPRGSMKQHHKMTEARRVGGTNNLLRAMFGDEDPSKPRKMCRIVKNELDVHEWRNGVMVRINVGPTVTHTVVTTERMRTRAIVRMADDAGMGTLAWCNHVGYIPDAEQVAELLAMGE